MEDLEYYKLASDWRVADSSKNLSNKKPHQLLKKVMWFFSIWLKLNLENDGKRGEEGSNQNDGCTNNGKGFLEAVVGKFTH